MAVLCQVKESKLCKYFEDISAKQKLGDGSQVFLDRDGPAFQSLLNYLRNGRGEMPVFDSTRDQHMFFKELSFWGFPDAEYLFNSKIKFPTELLDLFKLEPGEVLPITKSAINDESSLLAEEGSTNNMPTYNVD